MKPAAYESTTTGGGGGGGGSSFNENNVENKGIRLTSDKEFVVYGINRESYSTDAFLGKGVSELYEFYWIARSELQEVSYCELLLQ